MRSTYVTCTDCGLVLGKAVYGDGVPLKALVYQCPKCGKQVGTISGEVSAELLKQKKRNKKANSKRIKNVIDMALAGKSDEEIDDFIDQELTGEQMADETASLDPA